MSSSAQKSDRLRHALLSQIASQLVRLLVALGIGGWLARYLGPTAMGQLSYVTALVGVLAPLGNLGVKASLAALLCEPKPLPGLLSTALGIELLGSVVLALCLLPWAVLASDPVIPGLLILGVLANFFNSSEVFEVDLLNRNRGTVVGQANFFKVLGGALFTVAALFGKAPLLVFGAVQAFQNAVGFFVVANASVVSRLRYKFLEWNGATARVLLQRGFPLMLASFSIMLYMKSDQVMLEWLRGSAEVGQYSIAIRLAEAFYFVPVIFADTFFARIAAAVQGGDAQESLRQFYRLSWLLGMGLMLFSMFILPWFVPLVFGNQYLPARAALIYLGPANFAVCTGCASGVWLNAKGYVGLCAQRSAFGALLNVILNLVMIPGYGFIGAAIATSLSQFGSVYVYPFLIQSTRANTRLLLNPW
ncbi:MAG: flippase [Cyanobacteriota bacterium]|nr:flippase [Cyanobacteriota bacterium]